jgi:hypothetical protein
MNCLLQVLFQRLYLTIEILNKNDAPYLVFLKILFIIFVFADFRKEILGWVGGSSLDEDVFSLMAQTNLGLNFSISFNFFRVNFVSVIIHWQMDTFP